MSLRAPIYSLHEPQRRKYNRSMGIMGANLLELDGEEDDKGGGYHVHEVDAGLLGHHTL